MMSLRIALQSSDETLDSSLASVKDQTSKEDSGKSSASKYGWSLRNESTEDYADLLIVFPYISTKDKFIKIFQKENREIY